MSRKINVAFLGMGNVGSGVYKILKENKDQIIHRDDVIFNIKKILVQNIHKDRGIDIEEGVLTTKIDDILSDKSITLVVELMGGIEPAFGYAQSVLLNGISVVTANKELIAHRWPQLEMAAKEGESGIYFEASVGGGIPIIKTLWNSIQANNITNISAIINGTTNYILTQMTEKGLDFDDVLKDAQKRGLAEPDPTNDIDGFDSKYKLSILASLAFHAKIPIDKIYCEGIRSISVEDINYGKEFDYTIKLLALGKRNKEGIEVRVHPTFIPNRHPLSSVHDAYNAIFIDGEPVGKLMLYGRGAGPNPTASAIISDMVYAAKAKKHYYNTFVNTIAVSGQIIFEDDWKSEYYIRLMVNDKPGVLASIATIFAKYSISIESLMQKSRGQDAVPLIIITHMTKEKSMMSALKEIKKLDSVLSLAGLIRVER